MQKRKKAVGRRAALRHRDKICGWRLKMHCISCCQPRWNASRKYTQHGFKRSESIAQKHKMIAPNTGNAFHLITSHAFNNVLERKTKMTNSSYTRWYIFANSNNQAHVKYGISLLPFCFTLNAMAHICSLIKHLRTPKKNREIDFGLVRWGNFKEKEKSVVTRKGKKGWAETTRGCWIQKARYNFFHRKMRRA